MDYGLNTLQKKAILESSLANVKSEIFHLLLRSNIDPDVFDQENYTISEVLIGEQQRLETLLNSVELIERKLHNMLKKVVMETFENNGRRQEIKQWYDEAKRNRFIIF